MKKIVILPILLLTLTLGACGLTKNNSSGDNEPEGEEDPEDVYFGYPDDPEGYYLPKHATFSVYFETDANSNGSHDVHTIHEHDIIINGDEIFSYDYPNSNSEMYTYMKGRYIAGKDDFSYIHTWYYDIYYEPLEEDDIALVGPGWHYMITGSIELALEKIGKRFFFNKANIRETAAEKTGKTRTIDGEECDEYRDTLWGDSTFYYFSKKDNFIKGYRSGAEQDYQYYYIHNYNTNEVEIPSRPGDDVLVA